MHDATLAIVPARTIAFFSLEFDSHSTLESAVQEPPAAHGGSNVTQTEAKASASRHELRPAVGEEDRGRRVADKAAQTVRRGRGNCVPPLARRKEGVVSQTRR